MKTVKFAPHLVKKILSGEKTATWRLFDDKAIVAEDTLLLLNAHTRESFGRAVVVSVKITRLGELTEEDWVGHESYESDELMYQTFRTYYGADIGESTEVKIIRFLLV